VNICEPAKLLLGKTFFRLDFQTRYSIGSSDRIFDNRTTDTQDKGRWIHEDRWTLCWSCAQVQKWEQRPTSWEFPNSFVNAGCMVNFKNLADQRGRLSMKRWKCPAEDGVLSHSIKWYPGGRRSATEAIIGEMRARLPFVCPDHHHEFEALIGSIISIYKSTLLILSVLLLFFF